MPAAGSSGVAGSACGCATPSAASMWRWGRIAFSAVVAMNAMAVAIAVNTSDEAMSDPQPVRVGLLVSTVLVAILVGAPLVRGAWQALREARLAVEFLFVITLAGAFGVSLQSLLAGDGPVYFEVVSLLLVVYAFGAELNRAARDRAVEAIRSLSAAHRVARVVLRPGVVEERAAQDVLPGERVQVLPGEMVPVDGLLLGEPALFEEASLRGEFVPRSRAAGEQVMAGSFVLDAQIEMEARPLPDDSSLDGLLCRVGSGIDSKSHAQQAADRLARWFVPVVCCAAIATFAGWSYAVPTSEALFHAMAVLLVACPCALGFATPLALWTATSRLNAIGIRVSRAADVELLSETNLVAFDKTGTLSAAETRVSSISWSETSPYPLHEMRAMLAAAERGLSHPFARALDRGGWADEPIPGSSAWHREALRILPGKGIWTRIRNQDGRVHELEVVSRSAATLGNMPSGAAAAGEATQGEETIAEEGIVFRLDAREIGSATFEEEFRDGHSGALEKLAGMGVEMHLLSGDTHRRAARAGIAAVQGNLTPMEKLGRVKAWQLAGRKVLFVGDGINDAPAMGAAAFAIAVDEGTALARAVAGGVWDGRDLRAIPAALEIARQTMRRVRTNFRWALGYNSIGIGLAAAGFLHPVSAALLMVASSAQVTWRAMALLDEANEDADWRESGRTTAKPRQQARLRKTEPAPSGQAAR
ncbi:MAG: heavy metal translocating P-type ATPase [Bryobacterales bacterium]|nr:heavy metal translocating P-type ATPase [Bryobacterales bacterium]